MRALALLALALLAAPAFAEKPAPPGRSADWSPARATGPRDVTALGDSVNAWATAQADAGEEWLRLTYPEALPLREVRIWQNDAPGAVARVTVTVNGEEVEVWSGVDTPPKSASKPVEKVVALAKPYWSDTVTVYLDTRRVSGWNEIDAVEVVAADGRRAWASGATASSSYATGTADPLAALVGQAVVVRVDGVSLEGTLVAVDGMWLTVEQGQKRRLVSRQAMAFIEHRR